VECILYYFSHQLWHSEVNFNNTFLEMFRKAE
jgi:hypothetical protein